VLDEINPPTTVPDEINPPTTVPEPGSLAILLGSLGWFAVFGRRAAACALHHRRQNHQPRRVVAAGAGDAPAASWCVNIAVRRSCVPPAVFGTPD
jgi:hypothetical protein